MEWEKKLNVTGGKVWFTPQGPTGTDTLDGILECGEHLLIRFQVVEYSPAFPISEEGEEVVGGSAPLRPRSRTQPGDTPPDKVLGFCSRLLAPAKEEPWSGYVFAADVLLDAKRQVKFSLNDQQHAADERTLVEFAHLDDEYVLIRHREQRPLLTTECLRRVVRDKLKKEHGWQRLGTN